MKHHISASCTSDARAARRRTIDCAKPEGLDGARRSQHGGFDPDAAGALKFVAMGAGFMPPIHGGHLLESGEYRGRELHAERKILLIKTGGFNEYYGLIFGGSELGGRDKTICTS